MFVLWSELLPIILISAALPAQTVVTLALTRSSLLSAYAWVAGMMAIRLLQGMLVYLVLSSGEADVESGPRFILGGILLVLSLLLYTKALRSALTSRDEDASPPRWIARVGTMAPLVAFGAGAGFMILSVKFLVFTLAAISSIAYAQIGGTRSVLTFLLFVTLSHSVPLGILALSTSSSSRSAAILDTTRHWLRSNSRIISITLGLVFGSWFFVKALVQLGII